MSAFQSTNHALKAAKDIFDRWEAKERGLEIALALGRRCLNGLVLAAALLLGGLIARTALAETYPGHPIQADLAQSGGANDSIVTPACRYR